MTIFLNFRIDLILVKFPLVVVDISCSGEGKKEDKLESQVKLPSSNVRKKRMDFH